MKNTILKYGTIGGLISGALFLITFAIGGGKPNFDYGQVIGYASMIIALTTVFLGIKSFRDKDQAGLISFGKAFKIGILITLIASAFYVATWMIYYGLGGGQEIMDQYMVYMAEKMQEKGATASEIEAYQTQMQGFNEQYKNNAFLRMGLTFLEIFPVGLIITLISSFILKRGVQK